MPTIHTLTAPNPRARKRADEFELEVVDRSGQTVGELFDVMVDMHSGKIAYGVIELNNARASGAARHIAVPWHALYPDRLEDRLLIDASRSRIERAPSLPPAACSRRAAKQWVKVVDDYFHALPHWEDEALH